MTDCTCNLVLARPGRLHHGVTRPGFHSGEESSSSWSPAAGLARGGDGGERFHAYTSSRPARLARRVRSHLATISRSAAAAESSHRPCAGSRPVREGCRAAARDVHAPAWGRAIWGPTRVERIERRPGSDEFDEEESPPRMERGRLDVVAKHPRDAAADVPGLVARANVTFETVGDLSAVLARSVPSITSVRSPTRASSPDLSESFIRSTPSLTSAATTLRRAAVTGDGGSARDLGRGLSARGRSSRRAPFHPPRRRGAMRAPRNAPST